MVSQKCSYALKAAVYLARNINKGPVKIEEIAEAENIPMRFLETILCQLKHGGFVKSTRGRNGGYELNLRPEKLSIGTIIRFCDGEADERERHEESSSAFGELWSDATSALYDVYDNTTLSDMLRKEKSLVNDFSI